MKKRLLIPSVFIVVIAFFFNLRKWVYDV